MLSVPFADVIDGKAEVKLLKSLQDALGDLNDMKDLITWLSSKFAHARIGDAAHTLVPHAREELERRREHARTLVLDEAPRLVARMRRAAGVIGPMY